MYYNGKRFALSIFWVILGITLIVLSCCGIISGTVYSGMGGGLTAVGILQIVRHLRYRKNSEYREKIDIEENDERSRYLRMKSWSVTGYTAVLASAVGSVIAMLVGNEPVQQVLLFEVCLITFVYFLSYIILSRKY